MIRSSMLLTSAGTVLALTSAASAFVDTMYAAPTDPSTYGSLVASLDIASTSWDFPFNNGAGKLDSGYKAEILDGSGNPLVLDFGVSPNKTTLVTDVYRVTSATTIPDGSGNLNLIPGDLVFAYRIGLVGNNANTIDTLYEFSVGGIEAGSFWDANGDAGGYFDSSIVLGRGYTVDGLGAATGQFPLTGPGDFSSSSPGGLGYLSQLDFDWEFGNQAAQMDNAQQITILMFARGAQISNGFGKFVGTAGQAAPTTDQNANNAPILIPVVPSPGAFGLLAIVGLASGSRRRR